MPNRSVNAASPTVNASIHSSRSGSTRITHHLAGMGAGRGERRSPAQVARSGWLPPPATMVICRLASTTTTLAFARMDPLADQLIADDVIAVQRPSQGQSSGRGDGDEVRHVRVTAPAGD